MSRKQQREDNLVERLEREVRNLKAENRSLKRRLKKVDRDYEVIIEEIEKEHSMEIEHAQPVPKVVQKCTSCGKGNLFEVDIVGRIFINCDSCPEKRRKV